MLLPIRYRKQICNANLNRFHKCSYLKKIANIKTLLLDCDGVLWNGSQAIPGSFEALSYLKEHHKDMNVVFITNNSSKTRQQYAKKIQSFGYAVDARNIVTSGSLAAYAAYQLGLRHVLMIGNAALRHELESREILVSEVPESTEMNFTETNFDLFAVEPSIDGVVLGWDKAFTYKKLCIASLYLRDDRRPFLVTNNDSFDKTPNGRQMPVTGPLAAAIEIASGVKSVLCGKPSTVAINYILKEFSCKGSETLMVGDRLDTDIEFANIAGFNSCCVLTGCTSRMEAELAGKLGVRSGPLQKPTMIKQNFEDLVNSVFQGFKSPDNLD